MAEQIFRSPGSFDTESDQSTRQEAGPVGVPAGVIGTSTKGPAFVPITVRDMPTFRQTFGDLDPKKYGPYAVNEFLKYKQALTYLRVLGAGSLDNTADITRSNTTGQARNAGFVVTGSAAANDTLGRHMGAVQFLVGRHTLQSYEAFGAPDYTNNNSYAGSSVNLVRGMVLLASGTRMMVLSGTQSAVGVFGATGPDDVANINSGKFKIVLSSSNGSSFGTADGNVGLKIFTASLNPSSTDYFAKLLNRDPEKFATEQHLVYADWAVDDEIATPTIVAVASGSGNTSNSSGNTSMVFRDVFGHFDSKFTAPRTPSIISQPFGKTEYSLFHFDALDDGEYANTLYKISISDLKISNDQLDPYGTFTVLVRNWSDDDSTPEILEQFSGCNLNPDSENYVAKKIGDRKIRFNFDSENLDERRLIADGKYANQSKFVRIVMSQDVERKTVPASCLPFGFRGHETVKTNDSFTDIAQSSGLVRLSANMGTQAAESAASALTGSIVPPVPMRFKITRGDVATSGFVGAPGPTEITNSNFYWGVKFERTTDPLNPNSDTTKNTLLETYSKFVGIRKLDALVTGSGASTLNDNKFTLAKVAFSNQSINDLTGSVSQHAREMAYIRDASPDPATYTVNDSVLTGRLTLGSLVAQTSSVQFNRFSSIAKFTTFLQGGFDGLNILDKQSKRMTDKSLSFDLGGGAESSFISPGLAQNQAGYNVSNNSVVAYKTAVDIMTNPLYVNTNILAIPGIRESYVTDYAARKTSEYGLAIYLMDIPQYDDTNARIYDDATTRPDVTNVSKALDSRGVDNNYAATYFPDVFVDDSVNKRRVRVPASVAAVAAVGYSDSVSSPWYAPAGFNRASLDFVTNVQVRLNTADRDVLYDSRINPIATFPRQVYVIFGQKTLQQSKSALDRVNVRRLLLEVKRVVIGIANKLVFEQPTKETREQFVKDASAQLAIIQTQAGVEAFRVVMDETNNTEADAELNKLNGRIEIVPTRTAEFIKIDFIITNSGTQFV